MGDNDEIESNFVNDLQLDPCVKMNAGIIGTSLQNDLEVTKTSHCLEKCITSNRCTAYSINNGRCTLYASPTKYNLDFDIGIIAGKINCELKNLDFYPDYVCY